jgi:hypothetical protein
MVKQRYNATGPRLLALERRVEAISGEFKSQEVANTLWTFVRMGTKSLERMIEQLEGRYQGSSSTRMTLQTRCGSLRRWGEIWRVETISGEFK